MSLIETGEEVKFARSLVNPEKSVRDQTLQSLNNYAAILQKIDDMEMLKLWKGLYYCMWLSDKQDIQFELATSLANLIDRFRIQSVVFQYIRLFYRTILREWFNLDQYRVNKFYTLIRLFLNRSLNYAFKSKWSTEVTGEILKILQEEVLSKKPNGIRFHIADIFVHELWCVTEGSITVKNFITLIQPFIDVFVVGANDSVFIERVQQAVFLKFLEENAGQNENSEQGDDEDEAPTHTELFSSDITLAVQKKLFDLASEESTSESARKRLYALHKSYSSKSGIPFVSEEDIKAAKKTTGKPVSRPVEGLKVAVAPRLAAESSSDKKTGKKKRTNSETEAPALVEVEEPVKAAKKTKIDTPSIREVPKEEVKSAKKSKGSTSSTAAPALEEKKAEEVSAVAGKKDKKKSSDHSSASVEEDTTEQSRGKKLKSILSTGPTSEAAPAPAAAEPEFVASKKFAGAKPGYVFHNGKSGLGYYRDHYVKPEKKSVSFGGGKNNKRK